MVADWQAALVTRLQTALAVQVGARVSWFDRQRGDALPAITLTLVSPGRDYHHGGADGLDGPRVQLDCWAGSASGALALRNAALAEMEAPATVGGVRFTAGQLELEQAVGEDKQDGGQRLFRFLLDMQFYVEEI